MIRKSKLYEGAYNDVVSETPAGEVIHGNGVKVVFSAEIYQKLFSYIKAVDEEISGLGAVEIDGDIIRVKDVFLLEQKVSGASTRLDVDGLTKFYDEKMKGGDDLSSYKLWWHSHNRMATFWSGTDEATINDFDTEKNDGHNWMLSIEGNHAMDLKIRLDIFKPFRITIDNIPHEVNYLSEEIKKEIKEEVASKVHIQGWGKSLPVVRYSDDSSAIDNKKKPKSMSNKEWKKWKKRRQRAIARGNYYMAGNGSLILPGDENWPAVGKN